jgi:cytoskeletal protein RodZ
MAKGTFGERLKRERELREVTLSEIASATRIAPRFLEALENENWVQLPGGVFGRGFVRTIARYLGLSEEDLLSEYDLARGESADSPALRPEQRIPSPPKWLPAAALLAALAVLAALFFGGRYAWRRYQAHRAERKTTAIVSLPGAGPAARLPLSASLARPAGGHPVR